ncbi:Nramp family divalent metal transporter [Schlesneria paludicola]|uniref:Nramp family divalent metal transporter n=1 Tax=Schlesneria paludicola TaxID=360056 RepID=UPI00031800E9|nr:Nramp family divalent metal transporter [Schlesneria paludicola]
MQAPSDDIRIATDVFPPHPGSKEMPRWDGGELPEAPAFSWWNLTAMLGPGLVMASAAIGGGEWLTGPVVTSRYGGGLLWLAAISIFVQVIYNVEISRYTLYTGEPIFTGKFRTLPGPKFWLFIYLVLDCGSFLPYLASSTAVPLSAIWLGELPNDLNPSHVQLKQFLGCATFLIVMLPLMFGGKVYDSIKRIMTFKLFFVGGFLVFLALFYSRSDTWTEIFSGFFKVGNVPVVALKDLNGDGVLDQADSIRDNNIDNIFVSMAQGRGWPKIDLTWISFLTAMIAISGNGGLTNTPISTYTREQGWGMGKHVGGIPSFVGGQAIELSHVGMVFPISAESLKRWKGWVKHVSREQFWIWMPACFIGLALPSMLSVQFLPKDKPLKESEKYLAAAMTANGVAETVTGKVETGLPETADEKDVMLGVKASQRPWPNYIFWFTTLFCGVLVLGTSMASTADGVLRRWIDVFWTGLPSLRNLETKHISKVYFSVLLVYATVGLMMLIFVDSTQLLVWSTIIYNYALGFSCVHVIFINQLLLPRELHPPKSRIAVLAFGGVFFTFMAVISMLATFQSKGYIDWFRT